jgi:hypothetical protein
MQLTQRKIGAILFAIGCTLQASIHIAIYFQWQFAGLMMSLSASPFIIITGLWFMFDKKLNRYPSKIIYIHFLGLAFVFVGVAIIISKFVSVIGDVLILIGLLTYIGPLIYQTAYSKKFKE